MIHQVKVSKADHDILRKLVDLQILLLQVAVTHQDLDSDHGVIEDALEKFYADSTKAKSTLTWLTKRTKNSNKDYRDLFTTLLQFAQHPSTPEKRDFLDKIRHDIELIDNPQSKKLQLAITNKSPAWQKSARKFLTEFYSIFGTTSGFPNDILALSNGGKNYRRWDFIDGFTAANPSLRLCAVCDSTLYRTTFSDRPYTSVEHFFPKSIYPHLAIHPLNLIPICPSCNSGAAGDTDPFHDDTEGVMGLILPYQGDKGLSNQTYVVVEHKSSRKRHPYSLRILPIVGYPNAQILINNFEHRYKVNERWNEEMEWLDQHVFRRISQFLMGDVQSGNMLTDEKFVIDRLKILMAIISKDGLGTDPFGFATMWLVKHHIDSICESDNAPILNALQDWAIQQQGQWRTYRKHADEIIQKVPQSED